MLVFVYLQASGQDATGGRGRIQLPNYRLA